MNILEQTTEEQVVAWMIAKMKAEKLDALSLNASMYTGIREPGTYWAAHRGGICRHSGTDEALNDAIRQFGTPSDRIKELRDYARGLLAAADRLENQAV